MDTKRVNVQSHVIVVGGGDLVVRVPLVVGVDLQSPVVVTAHAKSQYAVNSSPTVRSRTTRASVDTLKTGSLYLTHRYVQVACKSQIIGSGIRSVIQSPTFFYSLKFFEERLKLLRLF